MHLISKSVKGVTLATQYSACLLKKEFLVNTLDFLLSNYPSTAWYRLELLRSFGFSIRGNVILPG